MKISFKGKMAHMWKRHIRPILVLILVFTSVRSSFADWNDVPTGSMKPTILEGDRIFVNKLSYGLKFPFTTWHLAKWSAPQRGEVVVFYSPADGIRLVKRVVGVPGDRISMQDGFISINGHVLKYTPIPDDQAPKIYDDPREQWRFYTEHLGEYPHTVAYNDSQMRRPPGQRPTRDVPETVVPEGMYYVMGDNRDNSNDSRFIGLVPRHSILGRANRIIFSLNYKNSYLPRMDRFFHALP